MPKEIDIYARVSRASDERMRSTEGQVEECELRLLDDGYKVGAVHVDNSRSAWNARVRRPGWDALMHRLETGQTDGVIVFDLSRFSRRPKEGERLIDAAEGGLIVLDSEAAYDLTTPNGKKTFRDHMTGAAYESDRLSTRVSRGKRLKANRGESNTSVRPFGFEPDGQHVRESEAAVIREVAERLLGGESQDALCDELNRRDISTTRGREWARNSMKAMLLRERNVGHVVYKGDIVQTLPGDPILTEDQWEQLKSMYASRRRGRPAEYLLTGLIVCECEKPMYGRPLARYTPYPDGSPRRAYVDASGPASGCGNYIDTADLDDYARELALAILADERFANEIETAARVKLGRRAQLDEELAKAEATANALGERLSGGEIDLARYDRIIAPLDKRIEKLRAERASLGGSADLELVRESRREWQRRWDSHAGDVSYRRNMLKAALRGRRIVVARGHRLDPAEGRATVA